MHRHMNPPTHTPVHIYTKHIHKTKLQNSILSLIPIFIKHVFQMLMYIEIIWRSGCEFNPVCITLLNEGCKLSQFSRTHLLTLCFSSSAEMGGRKGSEESGTLLKGNKGTSTWLAQVPEESRQCRPNELGTQYYSAPSGAT